MQNRDADPDVEKNVWTPKGERGWDELGDWD